MAGYADYQALADILAAIGTPAQGSGSDSIASLLTELANVITSVNDVVTQLQTTTTDLQTTLGVPAQNTGTTSIEAMLTSLDSVITNIQSVVAQLQTTTTDLQNTLGTPAQNTGTYSLESILTQLETVVTNTANAVTQLENTITQIQTGTPGVKNPINIVSNNAGVVAAGGQVILGPYVVTGLSYSMEIELQYGTGTTIPFATLDIEVYQGNGYVSSHDQFDLPAGQNNYSCGYLITGPLNGNSVKFIITNHDTVSMNFLFHAESTNIAVDHPRIVAQYFNLVSGYTISPSSFPMKGIYLQEYFTALAPAGYVNTLLAPYTGTIQVTAYSLTPADVFEVSVFPLSTANGFIGTTGAAIYKFATDANGYLNATVPMPKCACILGVQNKGASTASVGVSVTTQEF